MLRKLGISALGLAGIGLGAYAISRGTRSLFDRTMANRSINDIEMQRGFISPSLSNLYAGTFGGENIALNIGAGLAGEFYGKRLIEGGNIIPLWKRGPRISGGIQSFASDRASMMNMMGGGIYGQGPYIPQQMTEGDLVRTAKTNRFGSRSAQVRLSAAGASEKTIRQLKWGSRLRSIGRLALWTPLAYMAFEGITSLSQLPIPQRNLMPKKTTSLGGTFMDTDMAYTQRKRALQMIHNSQYAGRSALGNEASLVFS